MKYLRDKFNGIMVNNKKATDFSQLIYNLSGMKLGEGAGSVEAN